MKATEGREADFALEELESTLTHTCAEKSNSSEERLVEDRQVSAYSIAADMS